MALLADELVGYLVTKGVITAKGTDGFYSMLPDVSTSPALALKETGGVPGKGSPDPWVSVQCMIRGDSFSAARAAAASVYTYFHEMISVTLTTYRIIASRATALPQDLGEDGHRRHLISTNFLFNVVANDQDEDNDDGSGYSGKKDPQVEF
jgi:hypothetical protein